MPRYDGMDEIVQALQERLAEDGGGHSTPEPGGVRILQQSEFLQGPGMVEQVVRLLRHAKALRERLEVDGVHDLTPTEHDDVIALLDKVAQELASCDTTIRAGVPLE